jgi:Thioredoxin
MAPDWEQLAAEWEGHAVGLVAEVDCTVSEVLCQEFEVGGYPTLMFGDPSAPESYEGDRDFESMSAFAKEHLVKVFCSVHNTEGCTDEQKKAIAELEAKPIDELKETLSKIESDAEDEEARFNAETEKLQEHYEKLVTEYNAKVDEIRIASNYKLLRAVVNKKEDESVKTEL